MKSSLPEAIVSLVESAFSEMQADSEHRLSYKRRREIYNALKENMIDYNCPSVLGWLAVITAKHILHIFQQTFPDDSLPQELLDTAIRVLKRQADDKQVEDILDLGYHASGNMWGYNEDEIPWNVDMAANATYHALLEARGQEPLKHLDDLSVLGIVDLESGQMVMEYPEPISGEQLTDEQLCESANSDTAASAAIAFSCSFENTRCDPERLNTFWTWWLKEAIPEAWELAYQPE